jgi:hypothetical protein
VTPSAHPHERKVTQATIAMGGPIQGGEANNLCGVQDSAKPEIEDDVGMPGPAHTSSRNHLG